LRLSGSFRLRRFCLVPLDEEVPDGSTVRKLTRRLGPEAVAEPETELLPVRGTPPHTGLLLGGSSYEAEA
jgi:hypothetical protein